MSTTLFALTLTLGLAAGQDQKLAISELRFTYGYLGTARPKAEFLPGEKLFLAYNVRNMKVDGKGRASYNLSMTVLGPDGKELIKQKPQTRVAINYLGGPIMPSVGRGDIPLDLPPGDYTIILSLEDKLGMQSTEAKVQAKVLPPEFGIIHIEPSGDSQGLVPTSAVGVLGETMYVNFATVGFARNKDTKQPNIKMSLRLLDKDGKATMPEPLEGEAKADIPEAFKMIPLQFAFTLNRVGMFTVELNAKDELSGKTSKVTFPIQVVDLK